MDELYDPHAQLTVNTPTSPRLVPSGTDLWAEWRAGGAVIAEVRKGSDAEGAGIRAGSVIVAIDGIPISEAVEARMGRTYPHAVAPARDWALRAVLAGRHNAPRRVQLRDGDTTRSVELPARDQFVAAAPNPVSHREIRPGIGYVRFHDSLGDQSTVEAFDRAMDALRETRALIVDLRDTPSGGNSSVARGILGRFVSREAPYQKHVLTSEERETGIRRSWVELVSPRGRCVYGRPVCVLVDHWTGSMGEGLAIGFNAVASAAVIGTPMAGCDRRDLPREAAADRHRDECAGREAVSTSTAFLVNAFGRRSWWMSPDPAVERIRSSKRQCGPSGREASAVGRLLERNRGPACESRIRPRDTRGATQDGPSQRNPCASVSPSPEIRAGP
jgi:hypothetical protein